MKFFKPTRKKILFTILFSIILALLSMYFGAQAYIFSDQANLADPPVFFKISPIFWLPAWYIFNGEVSNPTILKSLLYTTPYWLTISYLLSCIFIKNKPPSPEIRRGVGGEV